MPTPIDRKQLRRLLAEQECQLIEALPAAEFEDEHLPATVEWMRHQKLTNLPVTTSDGPLVGLLTLQDAEHACREVGE